MRRRHIILMVIAGVILAAGITGVIVVRSLERNLEDLTSLTFRELELSSMPDGTYRGSFSSFPVSAVVEVTVNQGDITDLAIIEHQHGQGGAAEAILEDVLATQSVSIDTITGATYSSIVILKAIEHALMP